MGGRVLLALGAGGDGVAAALREAGLEPERCAPARLERALAEGGVELAVLEWSGRAPAGAPAWIALCADEANCRAALEAGAEAAASGPELLALHARRALARRRATDGARLAAERRAREDAWVLLGSSPAARRLGEALARVASTPRTTVLVRGPAGAPLAELARLVHARSARAGAALVEVEAAEAEAGAWDGLFDAAEGGSLVLREVSALEAAVQAALAARLEARADSGEGGPRLIATTSRDLSAEVEAGRLREDLAYRLNVLSLPVPALSERAADLALLAEHLAARAARRLGRSPRRLDAAARAELARRPWPGDLLELSLYMTLRVLLGPALGEPSGGSRAPEPAGVLPGLGHPESLPVADRSLRAVEEALIRRVLADTGGNKLRAAEILGIHRTTLYHKLAVYGLDGGADL